MDVQSVLRGLLPSEVQRSQGAAAHAQHMTGGDAQRQQEVAGQVGAKAEVVHCQFIGEAPFVARPSEAGVVKGKRLVSVCKMCALLVVGSGGMQVIGKDEQDLPCPVKV